MKILPRSPVLVAIAILALAPGGCEDQGAVARDAVQADLVQAATALRSINVAAADLEESGFEQIRRDLNAVVSDLKSIRGGEPGHQAARLLMLATAHRDLAAIDSEQAGNVESARWRDLAVAHAKLDAAARLRIRASAVSDLSVDEQRNELRRDRRDAERGLNDANDEIARVESPLQDLSRQNTADAGEVEQLEMQANQLRREAARHSSAGGFAQFEEAVQVERRADQIRYQVAQREIELDYELKPLHALWTTRRAEQEALIASIDGAVQDLDTLVQSYSSNADASQATAERLRNEIVSVFDDAERNRTEVLDPLYEEITAHLQEAAGYADQAASKMDRDTASTARLVAARANGARGRALAAQADGIAAMESLAARLANATGLVDDPGSYRRLQQELATKREALIEQAAAAFQEARTGLDRVSSRDARIAVDAYKLSLDSAIAALGSGESPGTTTLSIASPSGGGPGSRAATTGPFKTAEQFVDFLNRMDSTDLAQRQRLVDALFADSDAGRQITDIIRGAAEPEARIVEAMNAHFDERSLARVGMTRSMNLAELDEFGQVLIQSRGPDRVTLRVNKPDDPMATMDLVQVDGEWKLDATTLMPWFAELPAEERAERHGMIMDAMAVLAAFPARIEAGEFSSPEGALQSLMTDVLDAAGAGAMPPGR